jgi:ATP phosphoribosyltransferase regulatory subunit HisZ
VFQNAAANAPDEIKADMEVLAEAFATFYTTLGDIGVDLADPASFAALDASQQAELQTALESLSGPELEEASANLNTYFTENCS